MHRSEWPLSTQCGHWLLNPTVQRNRLSSALNSTKGEFMTLSDLASLGSFISGFAVLVSLIFLYFQLRQISEQVNQTERNQRALMQQGRANRVTDTTLRLAETEMSSVWCRARRGDK